MRKGLLFVLLCSCLDAIGQTIPDFRQFNFTPYLSNPALAGSTGYTKATVLYRKQWLGFTDSPTASGFVFEYPTQNKISLAANFLTQETIALRTSTFQGTFAYRVPFSRNQFLFFGLSGLLGSNQLDLSDRDYSNDPTILTAALNEFYANANFGIAYELGGLRLGFTLPKLFWQPYSGISQDEFSNYSQLYNQLYSINYKLTRGNFSIEPYFRYRVNEDFQNWWEAATLFLFQEKLWLGGSYHSTMGIGFLFGFDVKGKIRVGYSYELPPPEGEFVSASSHELQLQFRIGKKREFKWAKKYEKPEDELVIKHPHETVSNYPDTVNSLPPDSLIEELPVIDTIGVNKEVPLLTQPPIQEALASGYYIVAGSFRTKEAAESKKRSLNSLGYKDVNISKHPKNALFYAYVFSSYNVEECKKALLEFQKKMATKDVWILKID